VPAAIWNFLLKLKKINNLKQLYYGFILWIVQYRFISEKSLRILLGPSKEIRRFECVSNYSRLKPHKVHFLIRESQLLGYSSPVFDSRSSQDNTVKYIAGNERYLFEIKDLHIIGGSNLLLADDNIALGELKFADKYGKFSYSDEAILCYRNSHCLIKSIASDIEFNEAIFLAGNYSWNYYHFLFELMVKFREINQLHIGNEVPLLIDEVCLRIPQYLELLNLLNINGRRLIPIKKNYKYFVKRLFVISCPHFLPPNYLKISNAEPSDFLYDLSSLSYLRSALIPTTGNVSSRQRLFISRRKASIRRTYNEDEVFLLLQKYGFEKVYPEDYSFVNQMQLFNNANFIVGGSGAAFSNLLFCSSTCKAICLTNYSLPLSIFSTIASFVGFELIYLCDTTLPIKPKSDLHDSFHIDVNRLEIILSQWL
jgi:hypothetical protein